MKYVKIYWHLPGDEPQSEPIAFYYEIGENQIANRGLELFIDNEIQKITPEGLSHPIPTIKDINLSEEYKDFEAVEITKHEFEFLWLQSSDMMRELNKLLNLQINGKISIEEYAKKHLEIWEKMAKPSDFARVYKHLIKSFLANKMKFEQFSEMFIDQFIKDEKKLKDDPVYDILKDLFIIVESYSSIMNKQDNDSELSQTNERTFRQKTQTQLEKLIEYLNKS